MVVTKTSEATAFEDIALEELDIPLKKYRTIWLSDIHLGTKDCQAEFLLHFLKYNDADTIFLVGDIIDGWNLKRGWNHWPVSHSTVLQKLLRKSRKGTKIVYIPGNHDEFLRDYVDYEFGDIYIKHEYIHTLADGKKFLVVHGDEFDYVMLYARWLAHIGNGAYALALTLNRWFNYVRRKLGKPYKSLSATLKHKVKMAVQLISNFEEFIARMGKERGVDGVICGHIHQAEIRDISGVLYCNDGDWVESCTALVENYDGTLKIINWIEEMKLLEKGHKQYQLFGN